MRAEEVHTMDEKEVIILSAGKILFVVNKLDGMNLTNLRIDLPEKHILQKQLLQM